jgi:uncharacterized protein (TIGR02001 family)
MRRYGKVRGRLGGRLVALFAVGVPLWLAMEATARAQEQAPADAPRRSIILGARGGPAGDAQAATATSSDKGGLDFTARAAFANDYIYRGVSLSDRKFAAGAALEVAFEKLYAGATVASVRLPTNPSAEISFTAGVRPTLGKIDFDFAWTFYSYPNELWLLLGPTGGTDYWEASARAETQITEALRVGAGFAWSPNVSNTGAWGRYVAAGLSYDLPRNLLPNELGASLSGSIGYSRFGNMDELLGGFPLPAYTNWNAGVTFSWKVVSFDLRYYDTNLSKENCFVYTGDTNAVAGGIIDPLRNPEGLMSRWCGATVVGKLVFALN